MMSGNDGEGSSEAPGQSELSSQPQDEQALREKDTVHCERAVLDDETEAMDHRETAADLREDAVHWRERTVTLREQVIHATDMGKLPRKNTLKQREDVADSREDTVHRREKTATQREQIIRGITTEQPESDDPLKMMQDANAQLVISAIEAQKLAEQVDIAKTKLDHLAHHDALTGLPNRMLLQDRLRQAIELASRQDRRFAVLFIDLDRFKQVNDSLGHAVGDQVLQSVAQRLLSCVRHSDTISRNGGDEFVVLLSNIKQAEDAALVAQNMLTVLTRPHLIDHHELHVSVSIGIGIYPDDGQDAEMLLKSADIAMYHAKENGRNNYKFFQPEMSAQAVRRHSIEASLRHALDRHEFLLHYQPKIDLQSKAIVGVEALIRWQHPEWGLVPPLQFVPIAEDCGLILPIGRWVLREACRQAQAWRQAGLPRITVAVNTSALEFSAPDYLANICTTLEDTNLEPHYLEIELTESILMRDAEFTESLLHDLTELGIKLVIDDFGTGYSSLSYLRRFPIDTLKIDQSFVRQITRNSDDAAIVSAVISLGKSLKLRLVAEGVETPEQYAFLLAQDCDEGQGFYFGRPMVAEALATLLQAGILTPS